MDVNKHDRLPNITCRHKIYHRNGPLWHNHSMNKQYQGIIIQI